MVKTYASRRGVAAVVTGIAMAKLVLYAPASAAARRPDPTDQRRASYVLVGHDLSGQPALAGYPGVRARQVTASRSGGSAAVGMVA
jgi:hypothetical protein